MRATTYQIRFAGPTNHRGARWYIVRLTDSTRRYVPFDYVLGSGFMGKVDAIMRAFPDTRAPEHRLCWSGEKGLSTYYTEVYDDE